MMYIDGRIEIYVTVSAFIFEAPFFPSVHCGRQCGDQNATVLQV